MTLSIFEETQTKSILLLKELYAQLQENMSHKEIHTLLKQQSERYGFKGWLRPPFVRINGKTRNQRLTKGALIQIHLQPLSKTAFGSVGLSKNFQTDPLPIIKQAQELCVATTTFANRWKCVGELFVFARSWCTNHRVELEHTHHIGHQCFVAADLPFAWPYSARALTLLRRHQIQWFNPRRFSGVYAVHPFIRKYDHFAGFAELLYIDENTKKVLGRDSLDEIGVW